MRPGYVRIISSRCSRKIPPALFDHFKTMIQECTFSGFPSVELIRACWDKKDLNAAGIFVQQTVDTEAVQGVDVFGFAKGRFGLRSGP